MEFPLRHLLACLGLFAVACASPEGTGLAHTPAGSGAKVKFDVFHRPLPDIPLPNDFATRFDATTVTRRRLNASMVAPTQWESKTRASLDALDGWGTLAPISVSFDGELTHSVVRMEGAGERLSLVCEQYRLNDEEIEPIPSYAIETRARYA